MLDHNSSITLCPYIKTLFDKIRLGWRIKANFLQEGLLQGQCPPWISFEGILANINANYCEIHEQLRTARSTSDTNDRTLHQYSTSMRIEYLGHSWEFIS